jgi:hypothetical protein
MEPTPPDPDSTYACTMEQAATWGMPLGVALAAPLVILHGLVWGGSAVAAAFKSFFLPVYFFLPALLVGIVAHELVHGLVWGWAAGSLRAIRFGVQWKTLTPFAHCNQPLPARLYRIGVVAPGLLVGVLPAVAGTAFGSGWWAAFGWLLTWSACGDAVVWWLIRPIPGDRLIADHPTLAGCVLLPAEPTP